MPVTKLGHEGMRKYGGTSAKNDSVVNIDSLRAVNNPQTIYH